MSSVNARRCQRGMDVGKDLSFGLDQMSEEDKAALRALLDNQRARPVKESPA